MRTNERVRLCDCPFVCSDGVWHIIHNTLHADVHLYVGQLGRVTGQKFSFLYIGHVCRMNDR